MDREILLALMLTFSLVGLGVTTYQTYEHYFVSGDTLCSGTGHFSCTAVAGSEYGEFPQKSGIATAFWGIPWWIGLIVLVYNLMGTDYFFDNQERYLFGYTLTGIGFVAYLLAVELYILPQETGHLAICPLCTIQHIAVFAILGLGYPLLDKSISESFKEILT